MTIPFSSSSPPPPPIYSAPFPFPSGLNQKTENPKTAPAPSPAPSPPSPISRNFFSMVSDSSVKTNGTVKFLCSYGGKILPRFTDGKLRYTGGVTRVLSVDRSISFAELMVKLGEFCGYSVELRCELPGGDLETLVSVKSDEELANLIEEYDRSRPGSKIRAILTPPRSLKTVSPPLSTNSSVDSPLDYSAAVDNRRCRSCSPPADGCSLFGCGGRGHPGKFRYCPFHGKGDNRLPRDPRFFGNLNFQEYSISTKRNPIEKRYTYY